MVRLMIQAIVLAAFLLQASTAAAECYADYKAKKDRPLRLHYGVIRIPDPHCTGEAAAGYIADRIASEGWILLVVGSLFGAEGLQVRSEDAAQYFLRY